MAAYGQSSWSKEFADARVLQRTPRVVDLHRRPPVNPPVEIQQKFVGSSLLPAFEEAERFIDACFAAWPVTTPGAVERILDFGSGWGRITRMLLRRFPPQSIVATDVDIQMTALVQRSLPGVNAVTNPAFPPTIFGDGIFDTAVAFSVFSHLSEDANRAWAREFGRLIRPGGRAFITVLEETFVDQVGWSQRAVRDGATDNFSLAFGALLPDLDEARACVRRGDFLYARVPDESDGPRRSSFYSWAVAPRAWIERTWGEAGFTVVEWVPTGTLFQQALVVLERR